MKKMNKLEGKKIGDIFALSPLQEGMLFHYLKEPESDVYFEQLSLSVCGNIKPDIFEQAWNTVIRTNEMLRTVLRWENLENPVQVVLNEHFIRPVYCDISHEPINKAEESLKEIKIRDRNKGFDLRQVPFRVTLCKLENDKYEFIISNHHILYDGWSTGIILTEFFNAYQAAANGKELALPVKTAYKEFVSLLKKQDRAKQEQFWKGYLNGYDSPLQLSIKKEKPSIKTKEKTIDIGNYSITLNCNMKRELEDFAETCRVTLASVFYSAWGLLLQKYNGSEDVMFGTTVSGRTAKIPGIENMVGLFINTIPLRIHSFSRENLEDLLGRVNHQLQIREEFDHTPLVDIKSYSQLSGREELFDTVVVMENYPLSGLEQTVKTDEADRELAKLSLSADSCSIVEKTHYDLTVGITVFDDLEVKFIYNQEKFTGNSIIRLAEHFREIVRDLITGTGMSREIQEIEMISPQEKHLILSGFNNTGTDYPRDRSIHRLFVEQVERTPDNTVLRGKLQITKYKSQTKYKLQNTNDKQSSALRADLDVVGEGSLTYRELDNQSDRVAHILTGNGVRPDSIVAIMAERSVEMIIGILGILKAGGGYLPIDPGYPGERIDFMLKDSGAKWLVTAGTLDKEVETLRTLQGKQNSGIIFIDSLDSSNFRSSHLLNFSTSHSTHLAYIIYTSGSTGRPKGVLIEHGALVNLCYWHNRYYRVSRNDRATQYANMGFDASVWEIFPYLIAGACLHIISDEIKADIPRLCEYYEKNHITISFLPTQACEEFMKHEYTPSSLRKLLTGGDKLRAFYPHKYHLYNNYGPTENTVVATSVPVTGYMDNIPVGKPIHNHHVYILNRRASSIQPIGIPGEICIGGAGLARGYLNNPGLTLEKFTNYKLQITNRGTGNLVPVGETRQPNKKLLPGVQGGGFLEKNPPGCRRQNLYKTGDLGQWSEDGNIIYLGRIDQQVKVRGFRIEPGEIENQMLTHKQIKDAVVVPGTDKEGNQYLCAYYVSLPGTSPDLREYLAARLPGYMIPAYFTGLESLPITPSGKIDRSALPEPMLRTGTPYAAPESETETKLVEIWGEVLGRDRGSNISVDDDFFQLGGHSLKATRVVYKVNKIFDINIRLKEFVDYPTIRKLAGMIKQAKKEPYGEIVPAAEMEYYPLSYAQRRLWIICQFEEDSRAYNIVGAVTITGDFNTEVFSLAVQALIRRHESLRTLFINVKGEPKQRIIKDLRYTPERIDLRRFTDTEKEEKAREIFRSDANKVFDLENGPLFLFKLIHLQDKKYFLIFNCHHLVNDGWSVGIINNELFRLYNAFLNNIAGPLNALPLQYKDYTLWHNALIESGGMKAYEPYWLKKFEDKPNGIELPLDHPRTPLQTFNGGRVYFTINPTQLQELYRGCRQENTTLFMSLLALVTVFLFHYSGQEDIILASPIAGRKKAELQSMVGFLVNTLVYRMAVNPAMTFNQFQQVVKKETLEAYDNQDYPFDLLVEKLEPDRDLSRSPVFNVMLAFNNTDTRDYEQGMSGVEMTYHFYLEEYTPSVFDLVFIMEERFNEIFSEIMYNRDLFNHDTVERMAANFQELVKHVLAGPDEPLYSLKYITRPEYEKIIYEFNDHQREFPRLLIREMLETQVEKSGDKTAIVYNDQAITYKELNNRANRLAHYLREKHRVIPNEIVGVFVDRSIEMVTAILGTIKSGAGYVAIDPNYPRERVQHMLTDSQTRLIIIDCKPEELKQHYHGQVLDIYLDWWKIIPMPVENPVPVNTSSDILYVIYTSGSTGTPNGAVLSQGILANLVQWQERETTIDSSLRCLQFTSINFCVSFQETMTTLTSGGQLYLIGDIERRDIDYLMDFLSSRKIENLYLPFSYLNFLFNQSGRFGESTDFHHSLRHIITAGEQLKITAGLKRFLEQNPEIHLHNHYGSSEMHVVTSYTLDASMVDQKPIPPAGTPIANTRIYILDDYYQPVPIGVWGELFVSGSYEVLGYLHNETLTDRKLYKHPEFSPGDKRLYRSGDIGRWLPDGNIELQGRKDTQVKVRGFRIEPGEIESKILAIDGVKDCVVVVKPDNRGEKYLLAYVVTEQIQVRDIKKIIGNYLPAYMIPRFMVLDRLPLLPSGKVDRDQLPEPSAPDKASPDISVEKLLNEVNRLVNRHLFKEEEAIKGKSIPEPAVFIESLSSDDLNQLFLDSAHDVSGTGFSRENPWHRQFEAQVERNPDKIAIAGNTPEPVTYARLNQTANQLACFLRKKEVAPGAVLGLMMEPSVDLIIALLGVLKAGASYLFIAPGTEPDEISRQLTENQASLVLTDSSQVDHHTFAALQGLKRTGVKLPLYCTTPRPAITDFDMLPLPDRSLVNYEKYLQFIGITLVKNCITLQSTRGCPYHCAFCHKIWPKKHVTRSADNIFEEIRFYYNLGIRRFAFIDDIFNLDMKNSSRLFNLIIENGLAVQLFFSGGLRGDILNREYIDLMVRAGTVSIALALETASPRLQKLIGKHLNLEKFRENIEYICHTYPEVILELHTMHGFPTETEAEASLTLEFVKRLQWIDFPYIHIMKIYPNTEMEKLALAHGISPEAILASEGRAYHELQETLHYDRSFTLNYQADFLNSYFLDRQRLQVVLPRQMKVLTEDDLVQKYNSYLPVEIKTVDQLLEFVGISRADLAGMGVGEGECFDESPLKVLHFNQKLKNVSKREEAGEGALRVLLLDLSQYFSSQSDMLYDVVEAPLGLIYLLTWLNRRFGSQINGKIAKSRVDFDDYSQLRQLLEEFKPQIIGIRTLTFYKHFFHKTVSMIRHWVGNIPIIAGGPYATSDYETILQDRNIDAVVLGEGEITFNELITLIIANQGNMPDQEVLKQIPGMVFVTPGAASGAVTGYAREILFMDQLTEHLRQEPGENLVRVYPGDPLTQLTQVVYPLASPGQSGNVLLDHIRVNALNSILEKRFYETSGLENKGNVELAVSCLVRPSLLLTLQVMGPLVRGGCIFVVPRDIDGKQVELLEYYTYTDESNQDFPGTALHVRLIIAARDKPGMAADSPAALTDRVEQSLAEIWAELLGVEQATLGAEDNFFELGGHSLKATTLIAKIHRQLGVKIKLLDLFTKPTIKEIARQIKRETANRDEVILPAEEKEYYPLSPAQKRLYLVQQIEAHTTNYNMFDALELEGEPDREKFRETFRQLVRRQASFRTSFLMVGEGPVQRIQRQEEFEIQWFDLTATQGDRVDNTGKNQDLSTSRLIKGFVRPFDLSRAPLLRAGMIKLEPDRYILMVDMNHIISDGTSIGVFIREFMGLYRGQSLPLLGLQYKDYTEWQNSSRYRESIKEQENYWINQYKGDIPQLRLPLDFPRPAIQVFSGDEIRFEIDEDITGQLRQLALAAESTLYMVLLAIYSILLSKLSRQEDMIIGTPIAGRKYDALQHIIGMFVNTLAMRSFPAKTKTFREFLKEVKQTTLQAFENQDYPFEELVEHAVPTRDSARNPLFDVMFAFQNLDLPGAEIPGLRLQPYPHHIHTSPFELILNAEEKQGKLLFKFWFCTALFKKEKINRFKGYLTEIIPQVLKNKKIKLTDIHISHDLPGNKLTIPQEVREGFNF